MKIIISPFSRVLRNGKENPKNYPFWQELINLLQEKVYYIIQVGVDGEKKFDNINEYKFNLSLEDLGRLILECNNWISIDNFFQHYAYILGKKGFVIFSQSNPKIFGHEENINIIKDEKYFRKNQFDIWENSEYNKDAFVLPEDIINLF